MSTPSKIHRHTIAQGRALLADWRTNGQFASAFCRSCHLSNSRIDYWKRRLPVIDQSEAKDETGPRSAFNQDTGGADRATDLHTRPSDSHGDLAQRRGSGNSAEQRRDLQYRRFQGQHPAVRDSPQDRQIYCHRTRHRRLRRGGYGNEPLTAVGRSLA